MSWTFGSFDGDPVIWAPGAAFLFRDGGWERVPSAEVGVNARLLSAAAFGEKFGRLPAPPSIADLRSGDEAAKSSP